MVNRAEPEESKPAVEGAWTRDNLIFDSDNGIGWCQCKARLEKTRAQVVAFSELWKLEEQTAASTAWGTQAGWKPRSRVPAHGLETTGRQAVWC